MTELLKDILKQPQELSKSLTYLCGPGRRQLEKAARIVKDASSICIVGIGSSWHAGMAVESLFRCNGRRTGVFDASELSTAPEVARDSAAIILSRSGRSIEIVELLDRLKRLNVRIIAITNSPESPLAEHAEVTLKVEADFDHLVSITMYTGLAMVGGLLACGSLDDSSALNTSLSAVQCLLPLWQEEIRGNHWFVPNAPTYFLARGGSLASGYEARLLWEEAAKAPAACMTTGSFRHGSQEIIAEDLRFGLWLDSEWMRDQDLALVADIRRLGAKVLVIGQDVMPDAGDLVFQLPAVPPHWQLLIDVIPAQLGAEYLSRLRRVDCDAFRLCPYVIEHEGGLLRDS